MKKSFALIICFAMFLPVCFAETVVYNTKTHKETRIDQLSPYLHNEEYAFFNDYFIVGYTSQDESCVIDLKTNNVSILEEQGMYPSASTFFESGNVVDLQRQMEALVEECDATISESYEDIYSDEVLSADYVKLYSK